MFTTKLVYTSPYSLRTDLKGKATNFYHPRKILFIECLIVPGLKKT